MHSSYHSISVKGSIPTPGLPSTPPSAAPSSPTAKIAIKVINHYGDEVFKVYRISSI